MQFIWTHLHGCIVAQLKRLARAQKDSYVIIYALVKILLFAEEKKKKRILPRDSWPLEICTSVDSSFPIKSIFDQGDSVSWKSTVGWPTCPWGQVHWLLSKLCHVTGYQPALCTVSSREGNGHQMEPALLHKVTWPAWGFPPTHQHSCFSNAKPDSSFPLKHSSPTIPF